MINFDAAKLASEKLIESLRVDISTNLPMIPYKVLNEYQNIGTYDLIFPEMHKDFATRDEIEEWIQQCFDIHDKTNMHFGAYSSPGNTKIIPTFIFPNEVFIDGQKVRKGSAANKVGYGV